MLNMKSERIFSVTLVGVAIALASVSGCSEDSTKTGDAALSAEGKKISEGAQGGMKEFMQSKGKTKPAGR